MVDEFFPVVLSISGHDPSGGAGIQADIEAISAQGCHASSVITALTVQNSSNVLRLIPQKPADIVDQLRLILHDFSVKVIKIGLLGEAEIAEVVADILLQHPDVRVVLDPVLAAGGGAELASAELEHTIKTRLIPLTTVLTPNVSEARRLAPEVSDQHACGFALLALGCQYVLMTGADEASTDVTNTLYANNNQREEPIVETFTWPRLPYSYHGSGCTLASSIAALLAKGKEPLIAIQEAQRYTWNALHEGYRPGNGQYVPNRCLGHRLS